MYFHYEMLIDTEKEINLNALKFDLKILERFYENSYPNISYLIVYLLGKKPALSYTLVNTLYTKKINHFMCKNRYFETIKSKLPDGLAIENIDKLYEEVTKLRNNYEKKIKENFYSAVVIENKEDLAPNPITTISDKEQIPSPQINDKEDSKVEDKSSEKISGENGELFNDASNASRLIFNMMQHIKDGTIEKDSTWKELKKLLGKDIQDIKKEIEKLGVVIGNKPFKTIFDDLKERLDMC